MRRIVPLTVLLLSLAVVSGCSRPEPAARAAVASAPVATVPVIVPMTPAELAKLVRSGGRATILNAWASWCGPCREEFPAMLAAAKRHPGVRLVLVSADFDEQLPDARAFLVSHGVTDTTYLKVGGDREFIDAVDPSWSGALPATLVLDASGRKLGFWEGAADSLRFETAFTRASSPQPHPSSSQARKESHS